MKIALINENSQKKKNDFIYRVLEKVANKYHHEVFNYGVEEGKDADIDYVGAGVLAGILLNGGAVDFVITGCASGCGVMMSANAMPNVSCGLIHDDVDAKLFAKINAGNAVSIPFGKYFGVGAEYLLENIFESLFSTEFGSGYPKERELIQESQRNQLKEIKRISQISMESILEEIDKDFLMKLVRNDYFEENFFLYSTNDVISEYLKDLIDAF